MPADTTLATKTLAFRKYLSTNTDDNAAETDLLPSTTAPTGMVNVRAFRGVELLFFGTNADNETGNCVIWLIYKSQSGLYIPREYGSVAFTLDATLVGVDGEDIDDTDMLADTVTFTAAAFSTAMVTSMGVAGTASSPADGDTIGSLIIPDLLNADGIVLDLYVGTAANVNALYRLFT